MHGIRYFKNTKGGICPVSRTDRRPCIEYPCQTGLFTCESLHQLMKISQSAVYDLGRFILHVVGKIVFSDATEDSTNNP